LKAGEIATSRCQILRLKCTNFDFRWDSAPDTAEGAYSVPPHSPNVSKNGRIREREWIKKGAKRKWREVEGKGGGK